VRYRAEKQTNKQGNCRYQTSPTVCNPTTTVDNGLVQRLQSSVCSCRVQLHGPVLFAIIRGISLVGNMFPPKLPIPLQGSSPRHNTLFLGPSPFITPNGMSIVSAVFVWVLNAICAMRCHWRRNPQNCFFSLGFRHPAGGGSSHGHKQHIQKFGKDRACSSGNILGNGQTDIHTQRRVWCLAEGLASYMRYRYR